MAVDDVELNDGKASNRMANPTNGSCDGKWWCQCDVADVNGIARKTLGDTLNTKASSCRFPSSKSDSSSVSTHVREKRNY